MEIINCFNKNIAFFLNCVLKNDFTYGKLYKGMARDEKTERQLLTFHSGNAFGLYDFFGCHKCGDNGYVFRVWAPRAAKVCVIGDFNGWDETAAEMQKLSDGECFEIVLHANEGDAYKYCIFTVDGRKLYKADPFAFYTDYPNSFSSKIYTLPEKLKKLEIVENVNCTPVNIYEVNLLSWKKGADNAYLSYDDLVRELVPYVVETGYTHVEFMPVTEYPYDGSWGYQVTGYFAVTARLGTPDGFARLIDAFHENGIKVILDWVPAHFPKDDFGLYEFDGQPLYECPLWDRMEHSGWGTRRFDFGRAEVDGFLLSSAAFFLDRYAIDGLRVDAVASMLYLDYDRAYSEWTPNKYGDNRNLEALEFIKKFNSIIKSNFPHAITVAEESTSFPAVTQSIENGGLGFDFKWNMGWMNDVLFYCRQDPYYRNYHHNKITFSMVYAFSEKFVLPLSHDEVVHVKGSIVNKMSGEYEDKFAGERLLLGFMYAHPGKKLNFMGYEIAQFSEWNYAGEIDFFLKEKYPLHNKMSEYVKFINGIYKNVSQLFEIDDGWSGFEWLVVDDKYNNLLAFNRYNKAGETLTAVFNFSGVHLKGYGVGVEKGTYRLLLNSDEKRFGGKNLIRKRVYKSVKHISQNKGYTLFLDIPKLTCMYFIKEN